MDTCSAQTAGIVRFLCLLGQCSARTTSLGTSQNVPRISGTIRNSWTHDRLARLLDGRSQNGLRMDLRTCLAAMEGRRVFTRLFLIRISTVLSSFNHGKVYCQAIIAKVEKRWVLQVGNGVLGVRFIVQLRGTKQPISLAMCRQKYEVTQRISRIQHNGELLLARLIASMFEVLL